MKKNLKGWYGLDYVEVQNVPVTRLDDGSEGVHAKVVAQAERQAMRAVLLARVPIRGLEVAFFRAILGISAKQFGAYLDLSDAAILKWEHAKQTRLAPSNEIAVRALVASMLGVRIPSAFYELLADDRTPKNLAVNFEEKRLRRPPVVLALKRSA